MREVWEVSGSEGLVVVGIEVMLAGVGAVSNVASEGVLHPEDADAELDLRRKEREGRI